MLGLLFVLYFFQQLPNSDFYPLRQSSTLVTGVIGEEFGLEAFAHTWIQLFELGMVIRLAQPIIFFHLF